MKKEGLKNTVSAGEFAEYLENEKKLSKREVEPDIKIQAKTTALKMARELNPNISSNANYGTMGYISSPNIPPSVEKILADSETIYNWLTA